MFNFRIEVQPIPRVPPGALDPDQRVQLDGALQRAAEGRQRPVLGAQEQEGNLQGKLN